MERDLTAAMADFAQPLPAVNDTYDHFTRRARPPRQVALLPRDLDFLDPASPLLRYAHCLYSADFARRHPGRIGMVDGRDRRRTTALIDSGGFAFIGGAVGVDEIIDLRRDALVAQEQLGDAGVVVDVPTACVGRGIRGAETFERCLRHTQDSIDYVVTRRDPARSTRIMNMIQGTRRQDCLRWYGEVGPADLDGFGFAGARRKDIALVLELLVMMIRDGRVNDRSWFHVFGTNHPGVAIFLTAIQRELRRLWRSDATRISFDSSTSFRFVGQYGQVVTGLAATERQLRLTNYRMPRDLSAKVGAMPWPWPSPVGEGRRLHDFFPIRADGRGRSDELGGHMMSSHSLWTELTGIARANRLFDMEHGGAWRERTGRTIPYGVHAGVDRVREVFVRVAAGDFAGAIGHAQAGGSSLGMFGGHDPDDDER